MRLSCQSAGRERIALVIASVAAILATLDCKQPSSDHPASGTASCASCHIADYRSAPHHVNERPTQCQVCHVSTGWHPTVLNHRWPLTGVHANTTCFACHRGSPPVYQGTDTACVACHRADYDRSRFPGHSSFPTTCENCHTTSAWSPATWNPNEEQAAPTEPDAGSTSEHREGRRRRNETPGSSAAPEHPEALFPIRTGNHAGIACLTCHDQGGTMGRGNTDCVRCHSRARFDPIHVDVRAYPTGDAPPNFCVECHRRGTRSRE